ncbi:MAG: WD40 repeat domain-containing protein [Anaerolineales bacterium]|nr:WD40 repeat domain-containing protein [Anaerolineales bacterium]
MSARTTQPSRLIFSRPFAPFRAPARLLPTLALICFLLLSSGCTGILMGLPGQPPADATASAQATPAHIATPISQIDASRGAQHSHLLETNKLEPMFSPHSPGPTLRATQQSAILALPPAGTRLPHPEQTSDLLFISAGSLMRWDYVTGFTGMLASGVAEFSVSATGKQVAMLRPKNIAANGIELFNLDLLDFESKQIITLIERTPRPANMSISPDGAWVAYTLIQPDSPVFALRSDGAGEPIQLGRCHCQAGGRCLAWSPDSQSLLWSDTQGAWIAQLEQPAPKIVHPGKVEVTDPEGTCSEIDVHFESLDWSPDGRYVLVKVKPVSSGVSWYAILDTPTSRLVEVPGSFEYDEEFASISWSPDGALLVAHSGIAALASPPYIQIWRILATHDNLLIPDRILELPGDTNDFPPGQVDNDYCIEWLSKNEADKLLLGVTFPGTKLAPRLFSLQIEKGQLDKLFELTPSAIDVLWSPDGAGALILGSQGQMIFAHTSSGALYDVRPSLGADAHGFTWLPPAPRS